MAGGKGKKKGGKKVVNLFELQKENNVTTSIKVDNQNGYEDEFGNAEKIEIKVPTLSRSQRVNYDASRVHETGPYEIKMEPIPYDCTAETIENFFGTTLNYGEIENIHIPRGNVDDGDKFAGVCYFEVFSKDALSAVMSKSGEPFLGDRRQRIEICYKDKYGSWAMDPNAKPGFGGRRQGGFGDRERRERQPERDEMKDDWRRGPSSGPVRPQRQNNSFGGGRNDSYERPQRQPGWGTASGGMAERKALNLKPKSEKVDGEVKSENKEQKEIELTPMQKKELEMEKKMQAMTTVSNDNQQSEQRNFGRGSGNYGRGSGNYGRDSDDRRGYNDSRGYDRDNRGGYDSRGGYDRDNRGYNDSRGGYDRDNRGGYDRDNRGGYDSRGGYDRDNRSGYDRDSRGGYDRDSRSGYDRQGGNQPYGRGSYDYSDRARNQDRRDDYGRIDNNMPATRRPLNLKKRTEAAPVAEPSPNSSGKTDPFGSARPADLSKQMEKEKEIERRLADQRKQDRLKSSDGNDRRNLSSEKERVPRSERPKTEKPMPVKKESTFKLDTKSKFQGLELDSSNSEDDEESVEVENNVNDEDFDLEPVEDPENQDWTAEVE